jgi:hypothetical protein
MEIRIWLKWPLENIKFAVRGKEKLHTGTGQMLFNVGILIL